MGRIRPLRVLITGGGGLLGRALIEANAALGDLGHRVRPATRADGDLREPRNAQSLFERERPDVVVHCAARVGGVGSHRGRQHEFLMDNMAIDASVMRAATRSGVERLVYIGSANSFPLGTQVPFDEEDFVPGPLAPSTEGYALAKLAGSRLCQVISAERGWAYKTIVCSNLYGPGDDATPGGARLVSAALLKVHRAKLTASRSVEVWGDGRARLEFTYAPDVAAWLLEVLPVLRDLPDVLNAGAGAADTVDDYHHEAIRVVGHACDLRHDLTKPSGASVRLLDSTRARAFGWSPKTDLHTGMQSLYAEMVRTGAIDTI